MTTKREQILQAVTTALAAISGVTGVYRSREDALAREESPAVVVRWSEDRPKQLVHAMTDSDLVLEIDVYARGTVPDQVADPICEQVHAIIMADPTLGGRCIDVSDDPSSLEIDGADTCAAWVTQRFTVWYRRPRQYLGETIIPDGAIGPQPGYLVIAT